MAVDTSRVTNRRVVRYESYEELLDDARRLVGSHRTLGNWSLGQIFDHLAKSLNTMIDGSDFRVPLPMRLMGKLMKRRFLTKTLPAGYAIPPSAQKVFLPAEKTADAGLAALEAAVDRMGRETQRARHAFLGELTAEEIDLLMLRHAELHMSFVAPGE